MPTFIHGIGQCQVIDKSGELVDLKGHDISSLDKTGTFTWEHKADSPATLVGKILKAKKIYTKDDCDSDQELYFWNKCKTPYLYVMGELLDDYTASAKECAGQMKYSRDNPNQSPLLGFSIEGSELPGTRKGMIITRSIGRKVTLTQSPCNSACIAEIYEAPEQKSQIKDDFESIFKSSEEAINLFKSGEGEKIYTDYLAKKEAEPPSTGGKPPKNPYSEYENQGIRIGTTRSGKHVFSHGDIGNYSFNPDEHREASEHHRRAAVTADNPKLADNHIQRMKMHNAAAISGGRQENRAALSLKHKDKVAMEQSKQQFAKSEKLCNKHKAKKSLKKDGNQQPTDMSAPPPEPNAANASAMQAGAMASGVPSMSQAMANIKEGLGFGKSESNGWSPGRVVGTSVHYDHPEHGTVSINKQPSGEFHVKHNGTLAGVGGIKGTFSNPKSAGSHAKKYMSAVSQKKILAPKMQNISSDDLLGKSDLKKAIEAGSYNASPSTLVNGAAYQKESLSSSPSNTGAEDHKFHGTKKKDWKKRANDEYDRWSHKEKFEKFMKSRMPHLADGEIRAIGKTLAFKKSLEMEKSLKEIVFGKSENSLKKNSKIDLVHYSSHPNLTEVNPKFHGKGADSSTKGRDTWHPHSFYYKAGTEPETVVTGRAPHKYTTSIDTKERPIYDIGKDKEGHVAKSPNMEAVHEKLKEKGYHGFHNSKHDSLSNVIAMYHPLKVQAEKSITKSENSSKSTKLGNHFLFSAENPMHPHKNEMKMDHKQALKHLKEKGFNAHEVKGHYGSPETSIMVHNVSPKQSEHLHELASKLGQDSSIYSNNGKHEMRFHHGENKDKKVHGEGTVWHKEKPKDFYTTLPNGEHFTHNFNFDKSEDFNLFKSEETVKELDSKSLKDIQNETATKWADRAHESYKRAIDEKSLKWLLNAIEYGHEAIEHSSLGEELSVFEKIRAKLMPIHEKALKLLIPDYDK
jgi:predicted RNA binding protein YcfA (HicA-like mRNA interferase family)